MRKSPYEGNDDVHHAGGSPAKQRHYPNPHTVTTAVDLEAVARLVHVVAEYLRRRRWAGSFVTSNCLVMDVGNSHTEDLAEWVTPESLAKRMAGVALMTATSRNHQRAKGPRTPVGDTPLPRLLPN
ncbi:hypothetical protein [Corynebacterium pseudodiphtheriticum]|uniref:hypothetical protein n=1 Tax=Corynebacterium pseudodiphtheriticum TaxID=37637 RepID=UPI00223A74E7|nr:hypothetical protein [Corynebacterium pseudodiphtheriticum]MCT1634879.1 hypothetical protein [Corynebacterium pseudodiphtheriticum]MCT1665974.1 hypothetical protein [Corynebacterium pseudodiphtheriticum]MDK4327772.1 hypothetical protein [Corynebacterium pseudodiphtheriticum]